MSRSKYAPWLAGMHLVFIISFHFTSAQVSFVCLFDTLVAWPAPADFTSALHVVSSGTVKVLNLQSSIACSRTALDSQPHNHICRNRNPVPHRQRPPRSVSVSCERNFWPLEMSQSTDIADTASPQNQPDVPRPEGATSGSTAIHPPSTPVATHDNQVPDNQVPENQIPDFFKPDHLVQIPLHTGQDVTRARYWIQLVKSQTHPVLSDLEFYFRGLYDGVDGLTTIRVERVAYYHKPHADPKTKIAACLGLHSQDSRIPSRALNMYKEVTKDGGVWIARHWTNEDQNLRVGSNIWLWHYHFFKDVALRKEGKDWDAADLESVVEFFADLRGRSEEQVLFGGGGPWPSGFDSVQMSGSLPRSCFSGCMGSVYVFTIRWLPATR